MPDHSWDQNMYCRRCGASVERAFDDRQCGVIAEDAGLAAGLLEILRETARARGLGLAGLARG